MDSFFKRAIEYTLVFPFWLSYFDILVQGYKLQIELNENSVFDNVLILPQLTSGFFKKNFTVFNL